jgi:alanine-synthesizing transaminase
MDFPRMQRLPPSVFHVMADLKLAARRAGEDVIDLGMGNPDAPSPPHVVRKLVESATKGPNHRYAVSKGMHGLRLAICDWYKRRYGVELDADTEAIATLGSKEGLGHLALAILGAGDVVLCPSPTYPIHQYSVIIAGGDLRLVPCLPSEGFLDRLVAAARQSRPKPKLLVLNYPHNPTAEVAELAFFHRVHAFAREYAMLVIHDLAYADIVFDGYVAPSFLQVPGAEDVAVEFFSLSKSYNMPGWRVGFAVGNAEMLAALARMKSYMDYGMFQPIQIAAIAALNGPQDCVHATAERYRGRRDVLCDGLNRIGWEITKPKASMFVWGRIPEPYRAMGSIEFSKFLLREAKVAVSPGIGFGEYGDEYVRFALIENEHRTRQAVRGIRKAFGGSAAGAQHG